MVENVFLLYSLKRKKSYYYINTNEIQSELNYSETDSTGATQHFQTNHKTEIFRTKESGFF